ncbi:rhomboid-like protein 20 [Ipomoea triloba]|uniref:rhomboid-like protein 20 n=1 Tax=Ipomoea triloba TaxID=35885 RepID=UPI00125CF164|nr:rhomboid-like protein 20 [Ipomoea triloba]
MNGGPSGFNNAPVTRALVIACALFTIVFGIQGRSSNLGWSYQDIFKKLQLWKLIVSVFAFSSTPELIFGAYLLYYFRVFERQIGSNKYSVFILFSVIVSLLLETIALKLLKVNCKYLFVGKIFPCCLSSFLCYQYSEFLFLQLLFSSWKRSILPGLCGILAGCLYRMNVFRIRRVKFPDFIASFFSRLSWPSTGSTSSPAPRNALGNVPSYASRQVEGNYAAPLSSAVEPPEESITMLVSMGFDRNSARQALIRARNDVNAATNILLESQ